MRRTRTDPPSRTGRHPGSSPGAARLTTQTIATTVGTTNHNRKEHIMTWETDEISYDNWVDNDYLEVSVGATCSDGRQIALERNFVLRWEILWNGETNADEIGDQFDDDYIAETLAEVQRNAEDGDDVRVRYWIYAHSESVVAYTSSHRHLGDHEVYGGDDWIDLEYSGEPGPELTAEATRAATVHATNDVETLIKYGDIERMFEMTVENAMEVDEI